MCLRGRDARECCDPLWAARRSENWLQKHSPVGDECHEEAQHSAQDHGRDLSVLDVHPDEHEALDRQDGGSEYRQPWFPMKRRGHDEPDSAHVAHATDNLAGAGCHRHSGDEGQVQCQLPCFHVS
jgi:hypothetical protein